MIDPDRMWKGSPRIMIPVAELKSIAESHLLDAEVLFAGNRFDGVIYISGYVLEISLKARICETLGWDKFPDNEKGYTSFKTHNIEVLLHLSGIEDQIRKNLPAELSFAVNWNPECRYTRRGNTTKNSAQQMLDSVKALRGAL